MEERQGSDVEAQPPKGSPWANLALLAVSLLFSLVFIEGGYRLAAGLPVFQLTNWRVDQVSTNRLGERAVFDPVMGWSLKPWTDIDGFETIDHGIRRNFDETTVRTGAVLAVGDSFTEGWEVADDESWPAVLEKATGVPVVNAGIGGYGTDQIIMRAEQMLPIVKPKILIIGFLESDIFRAGHSVFGAPKPYFTIENDELRFHPPEPLEPVAQGPMQSIAYKLRDWLGYFATADYLLARLNPNYWYSTGTEVHYRKLDVDEAEITCKLLRQLKAQTDKEGIRTILFMQYYAPLLYGGEQPPRNAQYVLKCAQEAGIRVLDQFAFLRRIIVSDPNATKEYYMHSGETFGHMSAKGNRHAAHLLSLALQDWLRVLPGAHQTVATPSTAAPITTTSE
jgi:hypothetical protein